MRYKTTSSENNSGLSAELFLLDGVLFIFGQVDEKNRSEMLSKEDDEPLALLRPLDHRARRVLGLFASNEHPLTSDKTWIAFGVHDLLTAIASRRNRLRSALLSALLAGIVVRSLWLLPEVDASGD